MPPLPIWVRCVIYGKTLSISIIDMFPGKNLLGGSCIFTTRARKKTNIADLYTAGDICGPPRQVAKAVGEGCVTGL
jgi:thioredoxin reductase